MNGFIIFLLILLIVFLIYLFLTSGSRRGAAQGMKPFLDHYIAHRGFYSKKKGIPENSLPAFQRAVDNGYGIELDVTLSKDKVPVIFHDESLARVCSQEGNVRDYTYEDLQTFSLQNTEYTIPKFEEVLQLVNGQVPIIVEIKSEGDWKGACERAAALLDQYPGEFCVESFSPLAVKWFRKNRPQWVRGQLSEDYFKSDKNSWWIKFVLTNLLCNFMSRPDFIAYENLEKVPFCVRAFKVLDPKDYRVVWTIRNQEQLDAAREFYQVFIFEKFRPQPPLAEGTLEKGKPSKK